MRRLLTAAVAVSCLLPATSASAQLVATADGRSALSAAFAAPDGTAALVRLGRRAATVTRRPELLGASVVTHPDGRSELVGWVQEGMTATIVAIDAHGGRHTVSGALPLRADGAPAPLAVTADGDGLVLAFDFGSRFAISRILRAGDGGFTSATTVLVPGLNGTPTLAVDHTGVAFATVAGTVVRETRAGDYALTTDAPGAPAPALDGRGGAWLTGGGQLRHVDANGTTTVDSAGIPLGITDAEGRLLALDGDQLIRTAPDGSQVSGRYASPLHGAARLAAVALDRSSDRPVVVARAAGGALRLSRGRRVAALGHGAGGVAVGVARDGTAWVAWDDAGVRWARLAPGATAPAAAGTLRGLSLAAPAA